MRSLLRNFGPLVCTFVLVPVVAVTQSDRPVVVVKSEGQIQLLDGAARTMKTLALPPGFSSFAMAANGSYGVAVVPRCDPGGDGDLYLAELGRTGLKKLTWKTPFLPGEFGPNETEVYSDPAISRSSRFVAFVARPCDSTHHLDAVEGAGVVVIFDHGTGQARVLKGSQEADGAPVGYAMTPTWSATENSLYVNYETGFFVLRPSDGTVISRYPSEHDHADGAWSSAVGWLGSRCIVFREGEDFQQADKRPLKVLQLETRNVLQLGSLLRIRDITGAEITDVRVPYFLSFSEDHFSLMSIGPKGLRGKRLNSISGASLLPMESAASVPPLCR